GSGGTTAAADATAPSLFSALAFRYPFRRYQRLILEQAASGTQDHRYHIAAPPGAGKTIVGIELIRRFGQPAVVFAPTSIIQQQWCEKLAMFVANSEEVERISSTDPHHLAPINIFTYQLLAAPGEAQELVRGMARIRWMDQLLTDRQVTDPPAAQAPLEAPQENNPDAYARELAKRVLRVKHELLRGEKADVTAFLHPNALQLIDDLVAHGVQTIVLDECHHLLAYWA